MKRASVLISVLLLSGALIAQVRGVPASVTSYGPGRGMAPGVPASVTSLGPNGYSGVCNQPGCNNAFFFYPIGSTPSSISHPTHNGGHHGGHHHPVSGGYGYGGYAYIPYAYPVAVPVAVGPEEAAEEGSEAAGPEEPDAPAPTVFERRPVAQPAPYAPVERAPEATASAEPQDKEKHVNLSPVSEEKIPVVVVFKDGHQQEIPNGNYAIVGDLLYDLSGPIAHKIKLADLDLPQTVQLNEQRGVDFSLPAAFKPQA